jgi:Xylose isomerase-like TIM barrel
MNMSFQLPVLKQGRLSHHLVALILAFATLGLAQLPTTRLTHPIYPQSTGIPGNPTDKVTLIANAGYNGIMWEGGSSDFTTLLPALQQRNQKLLGIWRNPGDNISGDLTALKTAGELVFLYIPAGSVSTEAQAALNVARVADLLAPSGRKVAIYPHYGDFVSNAVQALRVAKLANRPNVGICFNQCHEQRYCSVMKLNFTQRADSLLKTSMAYVFAASINGTDSVGSDWTTLIRPLGEGNFDTFVLVKMLVENGFHGSFALQCYGLPQNPITHLANSMTVWKAYQKNLPAIYGCADSRYLEFNSAVNMPDPAACKTLKGTGLQQHEIALIRVFSQNKVLSVLFPGPYRLTILDIGGRVRESMSGFGPSEYPLADFKKAGIGFIKVDAGSGAQPAESHFLTLPLFPQE